jgi:hypothetical protein
MGEPAAATTNERQSSRYRAEAHRARAMIVIVA